MLRVLGSKALESLVKAMKGPIGDFLILKSYHGPDFNGLTNKMRG